jgi:hypothetical protein
VLKSLQAMIISFYFLFLEGLGGGYDYFTTKINDTTTKNNRTSTNFHFNTKTNYLKHQNYFI